jgi:hypothetical protein
MSNSDNVHNGVDYLLKASAFIEIFEQTPGFMPVPSKNTCSFQRIKYFYTSSGKREVVVKKNQVDPDPDADEDAVVYDLSCDTDEEEEEEKDKQGDFDAMDISDGNNGSPAISGATKIGSNMGDAPVMSDIDRFIDDLVNETLSSIWGYEVK